MAKKQKDDEPRVIRNSTTYIMTDSACEVTVTVTEDDGNKEGEPVTIMVEPPPGALSEWLEIAAFLQGIAAELTGEADEDDNQA